MRRDRPLDSDRNDTGLFESAPTAVEAASIAGYAIFMMGVCLLACVVPTRRALRVEPIIALKAEG